MRYFLAYLILAGGFFSPGVLNCLILRYWLPDWWQRRAVRAVMLGSLAVSAALLLLTIVAPLLNFDPTRTLLGLGLAMAWLPQAALLGTLPLAALWLKWWGRWLRRTEQNRPAAVDRRRRAFLHASAAALPLAAAGTSVVAITSAVGGARSVLKPLRLPGLPKPLRGLRILQLSDLHLGGFMMIEFLAETLDRARQHHPDLIVITGDFADDYKLIPEAVAMLESFRAPLGVWATLGNHEYGNGIERFQNELAGSGVRLLINEGIRIPVGAAGLYLAGIDDTAGRPPGLDPLDYLEDCVESALAHRRADEFVVLLSHRPNVFDAAVAQGVPLTLAGHTHGGQAALAGRSWLEMTGVEALAWGFYERQGSLLYTSSGAGQWVPVRLGCPPEAPVFELG
jgi:uncharacterized protein